MFVLEVWRADSEEWIALGTFDTRAQARARGWELRLRVSRVREVPR